VYKNRYKTDLAASQMHLTVYDLCYVNIPVCRSDFFKSNVVTGSRSSEENGIEWGRDNRKTFFINSRKCVCHADNKT